MPAHTDVSTLEPIGLSRERSLEAGVLLEAVTALREAGILTDAEYEAKRQRLADML